MVFGAPGWIIGGSRASPPPSEEEEEEEKDGVEYKDRNLRRGERKKPRK